MRWSLIASTLIHTAIMLAAVVVLPSPDEYEPVEAEAVPVEIVDVAEFSKRVATAKDGEEKVEKPAPKPQEEKQKLAPAPEKLPEVAELPPLDEVIDIPALAKLPEPEPEPEKEPEPEPKVEPEPKPEPKEAKAEPEKPKAAKPKPRRKPKIAKKKPKKKRKFDADALAALLDKSVERPLLQTKTQETGTPRKAERDASGDDTLLSATERDWLIQRLSQCWIIPSGVKDAERLRVTVEYETDSAGHIVGNPRSVNAPRDEVGRIAGESAVRAVIDCAPYDRFETFKNHKFRVNFDPKIMLNG